MTADLIRGKGVKTWLVRSLVALVVLDCALGIYVWRTAAAHPESEARELEKLRNRHRQVGDDVARSDQIEKRLPDVRRDCDDFFETHFLGTTGGYSAVVEDLGSIAKEAGLPPSTIGFKQHDLEKRGVMVMEVEVAVTVEGDYQALVRFINGLERSDKFYLLDSLTLTEGQDKHIKLNLQMKTYFRAAA